MSGKIRRRVRERVHFLGNVINRIAQFETSAKEYLAYLHFFAMLLTHFLSNEKSQWNKVGDVFS